MEINTKTTVMETTIPPNETETIVGSGEATGTASASGATMGFAEDDIYAMNSNRPMAGEVIEKSGMGIGQATGFASASACGVLIPGEPI